MGFDEAQAYLDSLGIDAMKDRGPSLHRIEVLCTALDHPERAAPAIHITGTNGKTSTARIVTSLLAATGLTVGTYTSPHLQTIRERIALSGDPITEESFGEMFDHLRPYLTLVEGRLGETLTYFEVLTALFFLWAAETPVDVMVVEVGLGGRWDATNVITAPVAVITNIGFDHTQLLGTDKAQIAREKAGIIKPSAVVVTGERTPGILEVIREEAEPLEAQVEVLERDFSVTENVVAVGGRYLSMTTSSRSYEDVFLPLHGSHQGVNAAIALEAVTRFLPSQELAQELVAEGFAATYAPGRLETVVQPSGSGPSVVVDVAHNPDGVSALVRSLVETFAFDRVVFVIGILADKDYEGMLAELARIPCSLVVTEASSVRSVPPEELLKVAEALGLQAEIVEGVPAAVGKAMQGALPGELVCVTGSHYVVGEARDFLARV
ncbi:MAG TPA: folylpolyglutamate synthase/dihydrofolate synthase family protein [Actinomycetota bacterium]|nr:folylpolyglutamate synthase/dihydrofolate synthase family protein [Actinomycetota bacterium]